MALWGPVIALAASSPSPVSFNAEQGRLCFTGALLVPLRSKEEGKRKGQNTKNDGDGANEAPPRVLLSVRTLRQAVASPLMVLDERHMQARCKLLFEEDAEFSAKVMSAGDSEASKWGVQLLGDVASHPCDCCDLSEEEESEEEAQEEGAMAVGEGKKRKRNAVEEESDEAPALVPAGSVHGENAKRGEQKDKANEAQRGKVRKTDQGKARLLVPTLSAPIASLPSLAVQLASSRGAGVRPATKDTSHSLAGQKSAVTKPHAEITNKSARDRRAASGSSASVSQDRQQPSRGSQEAAKAPSAKNQKTQNREQNKRNENSTQAPAATSCQSPTASPASGPPPLRVGSRVALPSGVSYEILALPSSGKKQGGKTEVASYGDRMSIQYKGLLAKNLRRFDSGRIKFVLGRGEVIKGMELGVKGMQLGESRRLLIPSALGYGKRGAPPAIPPNSDLIFECRLMSLG
ncbi:hypothetical protein NCLIV_014540 [Neospora caninum Liverpool]|uniref:peptidylprolyl isomerase n=1 Tax=Neospora caninum (strain Liverpool) TaxID=572307 RepID=F0VDE5_NEOCL|nr:hypothetical protein NCLIV_014540 [Neospora caninum Liverpool]CBZ51660.1 hypothetical protein NCLIV_014540 [Neospora caninum Liverpool]CEL65614.1 TPA: FK506-binding protein 4 [Neospora caninum Liverpool]|eukprot:XP_003881693.1 hypothetical protein NCLIV_014540 [Neospora caninum Liverpool]